MTQIDGHQVWLVPSTIAQLRTELSSSLYEADCKLKTKLKMHKKLTIHVNIARLSKLHFMCCQIKIMCSKSQLLGYLSSHPFLTYEIQERSFSH